MRQAIQQIQAALSGGVNWSNTILGAANPNTHWRSRGMGFQAMAYMDRAIMGRGGMPGMAGRLAAGMFGFGGGVNSLPAMAVQAVTQARQQEQAYSDLNRRVGESIETYARFREEVIRTGRDIGLTRQQILSLTDAYVSGVGRMSSSVMSNNLQGLMNLSKALGVAPDVTVGAATSLTRRGVIGLGGSTQPVNALISTAIGMGGMRGRETEVVRAIEGLGDMLAERLPTVSEAQMTNATMLMTVLNATGVQGLMGSNGMRIISGVNNFMTGAGGGTQQNIMWTALQMEQKRRGGAPMDLLSLSMESEKGIGSEMGLQALAHMIGPGGLIPKGRITPLLLKYMGITSSVTQGAALAPALEAIGNGAGGGFSALTQALGGSNLNGAAMPFAVRAMAGTEPLANVLSDYSATMSGSRRDSFRQDALGVSSPAQALELMARYGDATDQLLTEQDKSTKVLADFNNSLTDLATQMLPAVNGSMHALTIITNGVTAGLSGLNHIIDMAAVTFATVALVTGAQAVASVVAGGSALMGSGLFSKNPRGGIGPIKPGTAIRNAIGGRAGLVTALGFGAFDAINAVAQGGDPWYSIGKTAFGVGGSVLGGVFGSAAGPIGTVAGGIGGGIGGNALFEAIFGNGVQIKNESQLAQDSTLKELLAVLEKLNGGPASIGYAPTSGPWAPGGRLDESSRAIAAVGASGLFGHRQSGTGFGPGHPGIDLGYSQGEAISLPFATKVIKQFADKIGGNQMMLSGPGGAEIILAHLSSIQAKAGQMVGAGGVLGYAGMTGQATGPHLHFEVRRQGSAIGGDAGAFDPVAWFNGLKLAGAITITTQDANGQTVSTVSVPAGIIPSAYGNNGGPP